MGGGYIKDHLISDEKMKRDKSFEILLKILIENILLFQLPYLTCFLDLVKKILVK